jgi:hypothetical protein
VVEEEFLVVRRRPTHLFHKNWASVLLSSSDFFVSLYILRNYNLERGDVAPAGDAPRGSSRHNYSDGRKSALGDWYKSTLYRRSQTTDMKKLFPTHTGFPLPKTLSPKARKLSLPLSS